jgi:MFS family permease
MPSSLAILGATFSGAERGRAIGTWAAAGAITGAVGPVVGGSLVDNVGWRAIFVINLPIASGALWLALRYVANTRDRSVRGVDWIGATLATAGLGMLTWGLTVLPDRGVRDAATVGAVAAGIALLALFVAAEARQRGRAMMPLVLFGGRTFVGVTLLTLFLYAALGGLLVLLPYLLIRVGHYPAIAAGAAMLPLPILIGLGSRAMGNAAERIGPRWPLTAGPLVVAGGFALLIRVSPENVAYWPVVFPALLVLAVGLAISVAPLTATVMGTVDANHAGSASGVNNAVARVAGLIGTALIGLVLTNRAGTAGFVTAFRVAALVGAALSALAAASALVLIEPQRRRSQRSI